ncbi:TOPRIM nucleotidyl transferase/hydrolase domain-containing protein [Methylibium rhizosphaerae]|uniref:TOPRIM nucleotidyl transferase/hydrolase domain-containing protein n=1 Tax=Methylibium rhizosphaerae TaxID=2570323 RepID=UPI00112801A5|nr:TOPRIM nucleotidyl transferase/hydrolase domain-containing protein [Methylibium rhizosphaerae]
MPVDASVSSGPRPPLTIAAALGMLEDAGARSALLVEGWSDEAALEALARRRGWRLPAEGVVIVPIGGVTNLGKFVQALGPAGLDLRLAGLYDAGEAQHVQRALRQQLAPDAALTPATVEALGFFACDADLEDELIRALGSAAVERVLAAEGELESFRRFQSQPDQRGRDSRAQLRRFMGTRAGRKIRYGSLLVEALAPGQVPRALECVLAHARSA